MIKFYQVSHFSLANACECIGRGCTRGHGVTAREFKRKSINFEDLEIAGKVRVTILDFWL